MVIVPVDLTVSTTSPIYRGSVCLVVQQQNSAAGAARGPCQPEYYITSSTCTACGKVTTARKKTKINNSAQLVLSLQGYTSACEGRAHTPIVQGLRVRILSEGRVMSSEGATACYTCRDGYTTESTHSTKCIKCDGESYGRGGLCYRCPAGKWSGQYALTACRICAAGKYSRRIRVASYALTESKVTAISQVVCRVLWKSWHESVCNACSKGNYQPKVGQKFLACKSGEHL